jgi:DNA (cytosine-5)-methyltransferase 1
MSLKIVSLFSGAGGLDLGFKQAGFDIVFANEYDKDIWATYQFNHPETFLEKRSITAIDENEIPECDGIIGGPPCQSWSEGGARRGIDDKRGQLFFDFIRILKAKQPSFFLAENVSGMLAERHKAALDGIKSTFEEAGYDLNFKLLNAADYGIAQDRKRVIFLGFRKDLNIQYSFPKQSEDKLSLNDIIRDLESTAVPALNKSKPNAELTIDNHEYMTGDFSSIYMSRNRVRAWDEPSFTIQAGGRHAPIHPNSLKMIKVETDKFMFACNKGSHRRLSVRECARIQSFPDSFIFKYTDVNHGYKMIGNAVNVDFAKMLAKSIAQALSSATEIKIELLNSA